jgi:IclR family transcriptional regulator, acetate operon repressor
MVRRAAAPTRIQSVSRASRLLLYLAGELGGRTAKQAADELGLSIATTYHLLNTLVAEDLLAKDSSRRYHLGPQIGLIADAFRRQLAPPEYLIVPLRALAERTGETVYLSGWHDGEIAVLASVEGTHAIRAAGPRTGFFGEAHARSSGKLLLALAPEDLRDAYLSTHPLRRLTSNTIVDLERLSAEFERIRRRGYAIDQEEFCDGVACVAAPVMQGGGVIAAFAIAAPAQRFKQRQAELRDAVLGAASSAPSRL